VHVSGDLILAHQSAAEQQRVVRTQRHRDAFGDERADWDSGQIRLHAQRDVGRRAHLAGHALVREPLDHERVLHRPDAVPDPGRVQPVQRRDDARRAGQLAGVRDEEQPGALGDAEGALEILGRAAALVVGQAEAHYAAAGELRGEPGYRAGIEGVPGPVGGEDDRDPGACGRRRLAGGIKQQFGERRDAPVPGREAGRVGLQFQPAGALGPLVLGDLPHQPPQVRRGAKHRAGRVVQPLEPEPAALVGGRQPRRPFLGEGGRQRDAMLSS
jgi:hypothetical protein